MQHWNYYRESVKIGIQQMSVSECFGLSQFCDMINYKCGLSAICHTGFPKVRG